MLWSESRDLGECEGAVETWDAAGGARSVVESRDLDAKEQASAKICSRPGCKEQSECENLLETCTSRPGWIECEVRFGASRCACQENLILPRGSG